MLRKSKKFERPRTLFDKPRILEENKLVIKYGLKNKKEIWKAEAKIKYFRNRAKTLITGEQEDQQKFFNKLNSIGFKIKTIPDVLALNKEDLLKRRLPSVMVEKKLATKAKQARQMVVHKRILINGRVVNIPSYLVRINEENSITLKKKIRKPKVVEKKEEHVEEVKADEAQVVEAAEESEKETPENE